MPEEGFEDYCERLGNLKTRGELGRGIAAVVSGYSARDLKKMQMNFSGSLAVIDPKYKKKLDEMITGHLHKTWEDIRLMNQQGSFSPMKDLLPEDAGEYWKMVSLQCSEGDLSVRLRFLKFLLAGFCIFVKKIPPHPVGMPFPGGDSVQLIDGIYYCPAQQTPESGYLKPPVKRSEHRKQDNLKKTFDLHHYNG